MNPILNTLFKNLILSAIVVTSSACSLRDRQKGPSVSIQLPREWVSAVASRSALTMATTGTTSTNTNNSTFETPTSINQLNCFAINVKGPGILPDSRFGCDYPDKGPSLVSGFVPVTQSMMDVMVPAGSSRVVQLIGVQSNIGCPDLSTLLANSGSNSFNANIGEPYLLGEATVDVFDDVSVTLVARLDTSKKAFQGCRTENTESPTPTPVANATPAQSTTTASLMFEKRAGQNLVQNGYCSPLNLFVNNYSANMTLPSVKVLPSSGSSVNVYTDAACNSLFSSYVQMPTPPAGANGSSIPFWVKSSAPSFSLTAELNSAATGWAIPSQTYSTVSKRLAVLWPNSALAVNDCIAVTLGNYDSPNDTNYTGSVLPAGNTLSVWVNSNSGTTPSVSLYSDNGCNSPYSSNTTNSTSMKAYAFNTLISESSKVIFMKSTVAESGFISISRNDGSTEPTGIGYQFGTTQTVGQTGSIPVVTPGQAFTANYGTAVTFQIAVTTSSGNGYGCTTTASMPAGMTLVAASCALSLTNAVASGTYSFPVIATNSYGASAAQNVSVVVSGGASLPEVNITSPNSSGYYTSMVDPSISGSGCNSGATVKIFKTNGDSLVASQACTAQNSFSITFTQPTGTVYYYLVQELSGYQPSNKKYFYWQKQLAAPLVLSHGNNFTTSNTSILLSGTCQVGASVQLYRTGNSLAWMNFACTSVGTFSFNIEEPLGQTAYNINYEISQIDNGIESSKNTFSWTLDPSAVSTVSLTEPNPNPIFSNSDSIGISGTCNSAASAVTLSGVQGTTLITSEVTSTTGTIEMAGSNAVMQTNCSSGQFLFVINKPAAGVYQFHVTQTISDATSSAVNVRWEKTGWVATSMGSNVPTARTDHTAVWTGGEMIVWGGGNSASATVNRLNTGARLNPNTNNWSPMSLVNAPSGRRYHTAVWTGAEMIIWGGDMSTSTSATTNIVTNTGARYNPISNQWTSMSTTVAPTARIKHEAVWIPSIQKMMVWGGTDGAGSTFYQTGGLYDPVTDAWTAISISSAPSPRKSFTMVLADSKVIIYGGEDSTNSYLSTGAIYDPVSNSWTSIYPTTLAVRNHSAVWTGAEMLIQGGYDSLGLVVKTARKYNPTTNIWSSVPSSTIARQNSSAIWNGSEMIVWGGDDGTSTINSGESYNPTTNIWRTLSTTGSPSIRSNHTAVWTGSKMIIWGGQGNSGMIRGDGAMY